MFTVQYPVDIYYTEEPQQDYIDSSISTVFQVHISPLLYIFVYFASFSFPSFPFFYN